MGAALANSKEMLQEKISQLSVQLLEKEEENIEFTKKIEGDNASVYSDDYNNY